MDPCWGLANSELLVIFSHSLEIFLPLSRHLKATGVSDDSERLGTFAYTLKLMSGREKRKFIYIIHKHTRYLSVYDGLHNNVTGYRV